MSEIHATIVAMYGSRRVMQVDRPGTLKVTGKNGPVEAAYSAGDVILVDGDEVTVAPISLAGAVQLAIRVIMQDPRTLTDSQSIRALATAVIGFAQPDVPAPGLSPTEKASARG